MFTTDQSHPVLTRGHGSQVAMMIMRRAGGSSGGGTAGPLGALPASFSGDLPCADCAGIRYALNLFPDKSYFLRTTYVGRGDGKPADDIGRWHLSSDGSTLILTGGKETAERFALKGSGVLRKLDLQGREIDSKLNYDLRRTSTFERIEPGLAMRGMFRYMADAASFTECQTGRRWPVAMEGGYKPMEAAYMKTQRQPAEELLVNVEGQVAMRPSMEGGRPIPTLVVERYIGIWPGETCGAPLATAPLKETYLEVDTPRRQACDTCREAAGAESRLPDRTEPADRVRRLQQSDGRLHVEGQRGDLWPHCGHTKGVPARNGY
jgi:copper homeostasis protein (lipoprotein)